MNWFYSTPTTITCTHSEDDVGVLKPQGGTAVDNATTERTVVSHRNLREKMRIGTWNVRSMNQGKLDIVKREMERTDVNLVGVSEMKWTGTLQVGQSRGVLLWYRCSETERCRFHVYRRNTKMGFNPASDRIATIRMQCKPVNMTVLQLYAPTSTAEEEEMEEFYEKVQHVVDEIPRGDVLYVIGDWNAKVGQDETNGTAQPEDLDWVNGMNGEIN